MCVCTRESAYLCMCVMLLYVYYTTYTDESFQTIQDAVKLCVNNEFDLFALKVSKNGGITRSLRLAQLAASFGKKVQCNSMVVCRGLRFGGSSRGVVVFDQCCFSVLLIVK